MEKVYQELNVDADRHDQAIARAFHIYDHRFGQLKKAVAAALVLITLGCIVGIYTVHNISTTSTNQFCRLNEERFQDQLKQYTATIHYLNSPQSQKVSLHDLNKLIRQQIPKTIHDLSVSARSQPNVCRSSYPYPKVPSTVQILQQHG